jgi:hypothetical protein
MVLLFYFKLIKNNPVENFVIQNFTIPIYFRNSIKHTH